MSIFCGYSAWNISVGVFCYLLLGGLKNIAGDFNFGFKTKDAKSAGTSGTVSVKIYGTKSDSGLMYVSDHMNTAQMKLVTLSVGVDIGDLIAIEVDLNSDNAWMLEYVEITDLSTNRLWNATCFCMLSTDPNEGQRSYYLAIPHVNPSLRTSMFFSYGRGSKATGVVISQHTMGSYNPMACARLCIKTTACTAVNLIGNVCELLANTSTIETGLEDPCECFEIVNVLA